MKHHALEINVLEDNTALCWVCSPAYGAINNLTRNPVQLLTLKDDDHRVTVAVTGRVISLEDIKRIARQAVERDFDVRS